MKRREFIKYTTGLAVSGSVYADQENERKVHLVTLSFDDGFRKSATRTAEIYERFSLSACLNVVATGHYPDFQWPTVHTAGIPNGDFVLWNELKARGHEIMPHGYKHANKQKMPASEAKDLILKCLDIFQKELKGFDPRRAVFNFPYNASTPELEVWLPSVVMAYRTGYEGLNPLPHAGMARLTCTSFGPENCEKHLDSQIEILLSRPSGWLIYNTHGLDGEGWGPIRSVYLEKLLERLLAIKTVRVVPAASALLEAGCGGPVKEV